MNSDPAQRWRPRAIYRHPGLNPACSRRGAVARRGESVLGWALARRSRLCGPDAGRTRIKLDRPSGLELFAVEAEYHDLLLDHALGQKRAVVLTPGKTLTPVADLGLSQRDQLVAFDAQHLHQAVIVEERIVLGLVGPIRHTHGEKGTVGRQRDAFRRLTNGNGMNDARRFRLDI